MEPTRTFPLNAWYAAAWSHEVGRRQPLGRTVCKTRMVFWRSADGAITALEDACWHRLLPLSMGWLEGDEVVCRYHGIAFDSKGQCTRTPSQDKLNPQARVRAYPVVSVIGSSGLARSCARRCCAGSDMHWNDDPE